MSDRGSQEPDAIAKVVDEVLVLKNEKNIKTVWFQLRLSNNEAAQKALDNGLKVGVVGVIGSSQITSICSQLVQDVCFTDHIAKAKEEKDE